jgi:glycosyltransferase involved in cell wall biosynthesis
LYSDKKNNQISILFYTDSSTFGGAERYIYTLIKELNSESYSLSIALPSVEGANKPKEKLKTLGIEIKNIKPIKNRFDILNFIRQIRFFKNNKADIIHFNLPNPYHSQFSILASKIAGVKSVVVTHHLPVLLKEASWKGRLLERLLVRCINKVITVSNSSKRIIIEKLPFQEDRVVVIHNGIDVNYNRKFDSSSLKENLGIGETDLVVGTVGRLTEQKGYIYLLKAAVRIKKEVRNVKLLIVGEGSMEKELKRYSLNLGLERDVIFTGFQEDVYKILNIMDVFVLSSLYEGFPFVILEAMIMKKPVVATEVDGIPEVVINGNTGILVPPKDPEKLAKAVISLLVDREKAKNMGNKGFKRVKDCFSKQIMVEKTENLYKELLSQKG